MAMRFIQHCHTQQNIVEQHSTSWTLCTQTMHMSNNDSMGSGQHSKLCAHKQQWLSIIDAFTSPSSSCIENPYLLFYQNPSLLYFRLWSPLVTLMKHKMEREAMKPVNHKMERKTSKTLNWTTSKLQWVLAHLVYMLLLSVWDLRLVDMYNVAMIPCNLSKLVGNNHRSNGDVPSN
jgi:hypothetical protein